MFWGRSLSRAALASVLLAVAACTSSPAPLPTLPQVPTTAPTETAVLPAPAPATSPLTTSAPVTTPTTHGTVTATVIPTTAPTGDDEDAAASTAVAFLAASLVATVDHDLEPVRKMTLPTCRCLKTFTEAIKRQAARKHRLEADPISAVTLVVISHHGEYLTERVKWSVPAYRTFNYAGKLISATPAEPLTVDVSMQYIGGHWRVATYAAAV